MGTKSFVDYGVYKFCGSINPYFAEKTGFTEEDAECIKESLIDLFANDASSARPEGSMEVQEVFWFTHPNKLGVASSGKIHRLLETDPNMDLTEEISDYEQFQVHLNAEKLKEYEEKGMRVEILSGR